MTTLEQIESALQTLRKLDSNGWATLTDGTLAGYSEVEQLEIVRAAVAAVRG